MILVTGRYLADIERWASRQGLTRRDARVVRTVRDLQGCNRGTRLVVVNDWPDGPDGLLGTLLFRSAEARQLDVEHVRI